jgi:type IV pilus assembly protein PilX
MIQIGKPMKLTQHYKIRNQKGSILVVSLMILVVLTMIGVSSMSTTSLQERMAGNFRDRQIAFQAAEYTLAYAEEYARNNINSASIFNNTNGLYDTYEGPTNLSAFADSWWTGTNSIVLPTTIDQVRTQPRYIIEYRGDIGEEEGTSINVGGYGVSTGGGKITNFRVTVRATGLSDNTQIILQSNYGKRL